METVKERLKLPWQEQSIMKTELFGRLCKSSPICLPLFCNITLLCSWGLARTDFTAVLTLYQTMHFCEWQPESTRARPPNISSRGLSQISCIKFYLVYTSLCGTNVTLVLVCFSFDLFILWDAQSQCQHPGTALLLRFLFCHIIPIYSGNGGEEILQIFEVGAC